MVVCELEFRVAVERKNPIGATWQLIGGHAAVCRGPVSVVNYEIVKSRGDNQRFTTYRSEFLRKRTLFGWVIRSTCFRLFQEPCGQTSVPICAGCE